MGTDQNCQATHALTAVLCASNYQHEIFKGPSSSTLHERETLTHTRTVSSKIDGPYGQILDLINKRLKYSNLFCVVILQCKRHIWSARRTPCLCAFLPVVNVAVQRASKAPPHYASCQRGDAV
jgi:hypothetical protein